MEKSLTSTFGIALRATRPRCLQGNAVCVRRQHPVHGHNLAQRACGALCRHRRCRSTLRSLSPQLSAPPLTLAAPPPIVAVAAIAGAVITDAVAATVTVRLASCTCTCRRRCAARTPARRRARRAAAPYGDAYRRIFDAVCLHLATRCVSVERSRAPRLTHHWTGRVR